MNRRITINSGYNATALANPQSFITKSKKRLKQFTDTVYLNNGDEFEIELFNPKQNKVLAKIELNGKSIGAGIILRPGERVFLERYLDEAKKFLFETYVVNGNNQEVQQAIVNNGDVVVRFYDEIILPVRTFYGSGNTYTINTPFTLTTHNTGTYNPTSFTTTGTNLFYNSTLTSSNSSVTMDGFENFSIPKKSSSPLRQIETGRVEKGSDSNQSFTYDSTSFNSTPSTSNWWKILPQSTKPVVKEDLVTYCTECGSKRKKDTHKFCPHCGTKF